MEGVVWGLGVRVCGGKGGEVAPLFHTEVGLKEIVLTVNVSFSVIEEVFYGILARPIHFFYKNTLKITDSEKWCYFSYQYDLLFRRLSLAES